MNSILKAGAATELKDLISYEEGSIANLDLAHTDNMKFVLMAFDEGTGLTPHRAPGNAILTALEGKAIIGYEGQDYELTAGQSFRFDKNGLHSVTAQGKFCCWCWSKFVLIFRAAAYFFAAALLFFQKGLDKRGRSCIIVSSA